MKRENLLTDNKGVFKHLDTCIHVADLNQNYEIVESEANKVPDDQHNYGNLATASRTIL